MFRHFDSSASSEHSRYGIPTPPAVSSMATLPTMTTTTVAESRSALTSLDASDFTESTLGESTLEFAPPPIRASPPEFPDPALAPDIDPNVSWTSGAPPPRRHVQAGSLRDSLSGLSAPSYASPVLVGGAAYGELVESLGSHAAARAAWRGRPGGAASPLQPWAGGDLPQVAKQREAEALLRKRDAARHAARVREERAHLMMLSTGGVINLPKSFVGDQFVGQRTSGAPMATPPKALDKFAVRLRYPAAVTARASLFESVEAVMHPVAVEPSLRPVSAPARRSPTAARQKKRRPASGLQQKQPSWKATELLEPGEAWRAARRSPPPVGLDATLERRARLAAEREAAAAAAAEARKRSLQMAWWRAERNEVVAAAQRAGLSDRRLKIIRGRLGREEAVALAAVEAGERPPAVRPVSAKPQPRAVMQPGIVGLERDRRHSTGLTAAMRVRLATKIHGHANMVPRRAPSSSSGEESMGGNVGERGEEVAPPPPQPFAKNWSAAAPVAMLVRVGVALPAADLAALSSTCTRWRSLVPATVAHALMMAHGCKPRFTKALLASPPPLRCSPSPAATNLAWLAAMEGSLPGRRHATVWLQPVVADVRLRAAIEARTAAVTSVCKAVKAAQRKHKAGRVVLRASHAVAPLHTASVRPLRPTAAASALAVSAGYGGHTVAVHGENVVGVGGCGFGQLGPVKETVSRTPAVIPIDGLGRKLGVVQVAAGGFHTLACTNDGGVWTCGRGSDGAVGRLLTGWANIRAPVPARPAALQGTAIQVSAGMSHSLALNARGEAFACGASADGQCGLGCLTPTPKWAPLPIPGGRRVVQVSAGSAHSVVVTAGGRAFACGAGAHGQLGTGSRKSHAHMQAMVAPRVAVASAGGHHTLLLTPAGTVLACGAGEFGQTGLGTVLDTLKPTRVAVRLRDAPLWDTTAQPGVEQTVTRASAGVSHSVFLARGGRVFVCGRGTDGRLGLGDDADDAKVPVHVAAFDGMGVAGVEAGCFNTFLQTLRRGVLVCGRHPGTNGTAAAGGYTWGTLLPPTKH